MALACAGTQMVTFCSHRALHPRFRDPWEIVKAFCCKTCGRTCLGSLDFKTLEAASVLMVKNSRSKGGLRRSRVLGAFRNRPRNFWAVGMIEVEIGTNTANKGLASGAEPANHRANQSLSGPCRRGRSDRPGAIPDRIALLDERHRLSTGNIHHLSRQSEHSALLSIAAGAHGASRMVECIKRSKARCAAHDRRARDARVPVCRSSRPSRICPTMRSFCPAFLDHRPGTAPPCPIIVPVRCEPVPVYSRFIPLSSH